MYIHILYIYDYTYPIRNKGRFLVILNLKLKLQGDLIYEFFEITSEFFGNMKSFYNCEILSFLKFKIKQK